MFKFSVVVALALLASVRGLIGGKDIDITKVPYQVYVSHSTGAWDCSGAIISEYWVITSGQCADFPVPGATIYAGSSHRGEGGSRHTIDTVKVHIYFYSNVRSYLYFNDIALIKVNEPFKFDHTRQPIGLFNAGEKAMPGTQAIVSSWGDQENSSGAYFLRFINIPIVNKNYCQNTYGDFGTDLEKQICAGNLESEEGMCFGDTGAPLAINGRLAGVFSWGIINDFGGRPGVYTEISAYRYWIKATSGI